MNFFFRFKSTTTKILKKGKIYRRTAQNLGTLLLY